MFERIRKFALSVSVIVLFALYSIQRRAQPADDPVVAALVATAAPTRTAPTAVIAPSRTPTTSATAPAQARNRPPGAAPTATIAIGKSVPAVATKSPTATAIVTATDVPAATETPTGQYRDGTYTGDATDANWGDVQVEVEISGGQISNVHFLEFPNHRNRSKQINKRAMPILTSEAIMAQAAEVDIVSGATDTSEAFIESLDSALQQARP